MAKKKKVLTITSTDMLTAIPLSFPLLTAKGISLNSKVIFCYLSWSIRYEDEDRKLKMTVEDMNKICDEISVGFNDLMLSLCELDEVELIDWCSGEYVEVLV